MNEQPENLDVMMSLATVYEEQGKEEEALELVDFGKKFMPKVEKSISCSHFPNVVMKKNREARKLKKTDAAKGDDQDTNLTSEENLKQAKAARKAKNKKASIFDENTHHQSKAETARLRQEDRDRQNEEMAYTIGGLFAKIDELEEQIGTNLLNADRSLIRDYMRNAQELWEDFCSTRAFWPNERVSIFTLHIPK